ncbi:Transcriptional regulator MET32 [Yarrowia sp. B02]|nr:Transcriptional regulator MET32 [Yarrowia sp. B02]
MTTMEKRYYIEGSHRYPMEYQIRQAQQLLAPHQNHTLTQHDPGDPLDPLPDLYPHDFFFNTKQTQAGGMNYTDSSPHLRRVYPRRDKQTQTNDEGINFDLDLRISAYLELPEEPEGVLEFESFVPPPRVERDKPMVASSTTIPQAIHMQSVGQSTGIVPQHTMSLAPPQPLISSQQFENGHTNGIHGINGALGINGMHSNPLGERRYSYYNIQEPQPQPQHQPPETPNVPAYDVGSADKQFKCDQCECSFRRNHDLRRHKRSHLPVRPFPCTTCSRSFSRKDALKRHLAANACERGKKKRRTDYDDDDSA